MLLYATASIMSTVYLFADGSMDRKRMAWLRSSFARYFCGLLRRSGPCAGRVSHWKRQQTHQDGLRIGERLRKQAVRDRSVFPPPSEDLASNRRLLAVPDPATLQHTG